MTLEHVETFLTVVSYGSITAAADSLFISQSTVSNRIQLLERELDTKLLIRNKGHRNIELTPYGEAFLPIAIQWVALWKDTQNLKKLVTIQTLKIASVDAVNNYTFSPLFNQHIDQYPDIKLSINTHHSNEIHTLIENYSIDLGFVFSQVRYPDIISKPIYQELMYLICHIDSDYRNNIHPDELRPEDEIFLPWGQDIQHWHDQHWDSDRYPLITVNTGSMLQYYLQTPGRWAVAPLSVVQAICKANPDITYYTLQKAPPPRICYQLVHRHPKSSQTNAIHIFEKELQEFISHSSSIDTFEPWMLGNA